jgi:hypothetical protein
VLRTTYVIGRVSAPYSGDLLVRHPSGQMEAFAIDPTGWRLDAARIIDGSRPVIRATLEYGLEKLSRVRISLAEPAPPPGEPPFEEDLTEGVITGIVLQETWRNDLKVKGLLRGDLVAVLDRTEVPEPDVAPEENKEEDSEPVDPELVGDLGSNAASGSRDSNWDRDQDRNPERADSLTRPGSFEESYAFSSRSLGTETGAGFPEDETHDEHTDSSASVLINAESQAHSPTGGHHWRRYANWSHVRQTARFAASRVSTWSIHRARYAFRIVTGSEQWSALLAFLAALLYISTLWSFVTTSTVPRRIATATLVVLVVALIYSVVLDADEAEDLMRSNSGRWVRAFFLWLFVTVLFWPSATVSATGLLLLVAYGYVLSERPFR